MHAALRSLLVVCLFAAACAGASPPRAGTREQPIDVRSSTLPFKIDEPAAKQLGRLVWRGGVAMTANAPEFGGWSDLHVAPDGRTLTAISDQGTWLTATIEYDGNAVNLAGLKDATIGPLRDLDGKPIAAKLDADAEGLTLLPDRSWMVAFERHHRLWRYPTLTATPQRVEGPAEIGRQPDNGGMEALAALADGRIIAISEAYSERAGSVRGWIGRSMGSNRYHWDPFDYATIPDFRPTAISVLPDGSLVIIERAFDVVRGVRCRIMRFGAAQLTPGGLVRAEEMARLASPYAVDNLEGVSATRGARGETLLWLMSDDNFNPMQRNILLLFELQ